MGAMLPAVAPLAAVYSRTVLSRRMLRLTGGGSAAAVDRPPQLLGLAEGSGSSAQTSGVQDCSVVSGSWPVAATLATVLKS